MDGSALVQTLTGSFSWSGNTMTFDPASDLDKSVGNTATVTTPPET